MLSHRTATRKPNQSDECSLLLLPFFEKENTFNNFCDVWLLQVFHYRSHSMFHRCCHYSLLTFNYSIMKWACAFCPLFTTSAYLLSFVRRELLAFLLLLLLAFFFRLKQLVQFFSTFTATNYHVYASLVLCESVSARWAKCGTFELVGNTPLWPTLCREYKGHQETRKWKIQRQHHTQKNAQPQIMNTSHFRKKLNIFRHVRTTIAPK